MTLDEFLKQRPGEIGAVAKSAGIGVSSLARARADGCKTRAVALKLHHATGGACSVLELLFPNGQPAAPVKGPTSRAA
jgi:hypothetical protein